MYVAGFAKEKECLFSLVLLPWLWPIVSSTVLMESSFNGNPSNGSKDLSVKTTNMNLMVEKSAELVGKI